MGLKASAKKNLVAQAVVGAGPCFILVFIHHSHRTNLFRKSCHLNRNQGSSRPLAKGNNIVRCDGQPVSHEITEDAITTTPQQH